MDLNKKAKEQLIEMFSTYLKGRKKKAVKLAEEIYKNFSAATGSLLDKLTSEAVNMAGELWSKEDISKEKVETILKELKQFQKL